MEASFRNKGQITELTGCDLLTISPQFLGELSDSTEPLSKHLDAHRAKDMEIQKLTIDEGAFRFGLNEDPMANDKLADGIRRFAADTVKLEQLLAKIHKL